jgi:hypothetical protein
MNWTSQKSNSKMISMKITIDVSRSPLNSLRKRVTFIKIERHEWECYLIFIFSCLLRMTYDILGWDSSIFQMDSPIGYPKLDQDTTGRALSNGLFTFFRTPPYPEKISKYS